MTFRTVSVSAEWALHGKTPEDTGYRLLGWSDGKLSGRNFEEAIYRFSTGTLETLPQVSVSYLTRADQAGGGYLALAIQELAEGERDAIGREIINTRFFCASYEQLAAEAITYQAMYQAFRAVQLPRSDGPPLEAELAVPPSRLPPAGDLAYQVAALLLDGPVCVLGADRAGVEDRLGFIDTVMSLLPYGMRSRMSASTWTSPTYQTHRFRLFFSDAPRVTDRRDHAVVWGQPERTEISADLRSAHQYLDWLRSDVQGPVLRLAGMTGELGFGPKHVLKMLELTGAASLRPDPGYPDLSPPSSPENSSYAETLLLESADRIAAGDLTGLKSAMDDLRAFAEGASREEDRERYQDIIRSRRLLGPGLPIGGLEGWYYYMLLRLAFGTPLSYEGYCQLESCLDVSPGQAPHRPLLEAIKHGGMDGNLVTALVLGYLGDGDLSDWFRQSGQIDIAELITWLGGERDRPDHARVVCDATLQYLREMPGNYDRQAVLSALRDHGYLAQALLLQHPDAPQYQLHAAYHLLRAAFGAALDRSTAEEVLGGSQSAPTPALLGAVLLLLTSPATDARYVREAYLTAQLRLTAFDPDMRARLERLASGRRIPASDRRVIEAPPQPGSPRSLAEPPEQPTALKDLPWRRESRHRPDSPFRARRRGRLYRPVVGKQDGI